MRRNLGAAIRAAALSALLLGPPAAAATPKGSRQPTGKWSVETASNECLLVRPYGSPRNPLFLVLSKAPMLGGGSATILYNREWALAENGSAKVRFDDGDWMPVTFSAQLLWNLTKDIKTRTLRSVQIYDDEDSGILLRDASSVAFGVPGELRIAFALPEHEQALEALDGCAVALGIKWGFPLEEQRRIATPPDSEGGLQRLFSPDDYPDLAVKEGRMGRARVRLNVSESGAASGCSVIASTGHADLDRMTCKILDERAQFKPARDVDGKATRSVIVTTVSWRLG
jgi:TonB family protein